MKTTIYHRTYCKTCINFTVHKRETSDNLVCQKCNTIFTNYITSEVPEELITEQRKRYKSQKINKIKQHFNYLGFLNSFSTTSKINTNIIECDAGQDIIDRKNRQEKEKARQFKKELQEKFNTNFSKLNRNDKCACGSNKKYKQCCQPIFIANKITN